MRRDDARTVALHILDACFGRLPAHAPGLEPFQEHACHRLRGIIERRGGALLADSVGLGKTHVAAALIRDEIDAGGTVLVTAPAQLHAHWKRHLRGLARSWFRSHTALSRGSGRVAPATLVVVDEAHAFRNPHTRRYAALAMLCEHARVLLITATPVNNSLLDFYHLVRLFAPRDLFADIGVPDLLAAVESALRGGTATELRRVADAVMVRRTRRVIASAQWSGTAGALRFPEKGAIEVLHYDMPSDLTECVRLSVPSLVFPAHGLDGDSAPRELMRLGLLKRLESSTWAFRASIRRHMRVLEHFVSAASDGLLFDPRRDRAHLADVDGAVQLSLQAVALSPWPRALDRARLTAAAAHDLALLRQLHSLLNRDVNREEPKLACLDRLLDGIDEKVLLFTEYQETARGLWRALSWRDGTALIHGSDARLGRNRSGRRAVIERFAPIANHARVPRTVERVRLLIATDVLAEGLNLQDAAVLISYDLPWNPVRLAQRIGRIDRLGSPHRRIRAVAFAPDPGVDELLGLMKRIRRKLRHIRVIGGDAPWSLTGARRSARIIEEIDHAGDARERAYAFWRSASSEVRGRSGAADAGSTDARSADARSADAGSAVATGVAVAVMPWDRECSGALCCFRGSGEALLVLALEDRSAEVGTAACWTTLADALTASAPLAGDSASEGIAIEAEVRAAERIARKALRPQQRRSSPRPEPGFAAAGAAVLRWLADRPGGPAEEDMAAADRMLRSLSTERRAGTDIRFRGILRSASSAEAAVEALRSLAVANEGSAATPPSARAWRAARVDLSTALPLPSRPAPRGSLQLVGVVLLQRRISP